MEIGLGVILFLTLIISYVIVQETRARLHWRSLVKGGDMTAITSLTEDQVSYWRRSRVPRGTPVSLWRGVQSTEVLEISPSDLRVSCSVEGQYATVDGKRKEVSSALAEAFKLTARLADMLLYDIPDVRFDRVRIDVFSTFREASGVATQQCILTTTASREVAEDLDWEGLGPEEVVRAFGGEYRTGPNGVALPLPIEIPPPRMDTAAAGA